MSRYVTYLCNASLVIVSLAIEMTCIESLEAR